MRFKPTTPEIVFGVLGLFFGSGITIAATQSTSPQENFRGAVLSFTEAGMKPNTVVTSLGNFAIERPYKPGSTLLASYVMNGEAVMGALNPLDATTEDAALMACADDVANGSVSDEAITAFDAAFPNQSSSPSPNTSPTQIPEAAFGKAYKICFGDLANAAGKATVTVILGVKSS
ncbi:MAG TPA: hypothetical protein VLG47_07415 [Candidatus Saccharimonadales bacterium]|nr:hypothetical protein [Candidatus Saccharimonadales bacterium]